MRRDTLAEELGDWTGYEIRLRCGGPADDNATIAELHHEGACHARDFGGGALAHMVQALTEKVLLARAQAEEAGRQTSRARFAAFSTPDLLGELDAREDDARREERGEDVDRAYPSGIPHEIYPEE